MSVTRHGIQAIKKLRPFSAVNTDWEVGKYPNRQLDMVQADASVYEKALYKHKYITDDYCKYGLLFDDMLNEVDPAVEEARKRMTDEETQARYFRVNRALLLSANHQLLPPDQWTPMDAEHHYLRPRIDEVKKEMMERKLVKCAMLDFEDYLERIMLIPFRMWNVFKIRKLRGRLMKELVL